MWGRWKDALGVLRKTKEEKDLAKKQKLAMIKEMKKPNPPSATKTASVQGQGQGKSPNPPSKQQQLLLTKPDRLLPTHINSNDENDGKTEGGGGTVAGCLSAASSSSSSSSSSSMLVHALALGATNNSSCNLSITLHFIVLPTLTLTLTSPQP